MKLGALTFGAHRLIIVIFFWCIAPFISINCPSLSHLTNLSIAATVVFGIIGNLSIVNPADWLGQSSSRLSP
jgi:hypothetical protein